MYISSIAEKKKKKKNENETYVAKNYTYQEPISIAI